MIHQIINLWLDGWKLLKSTMSVAMEVFEVHEPLISKELAEDIAKNNDKINWDKYEKL